jgi:hypothetical protein
MFAEYSLPHWLSSFRSLERIIPQGTMMKNGIAGWGALGQLPLLWRFAGASAKSDVADALVAAPHLCWAQMIGRWVVWCALSLCLYLHLYLHLISVTSW